jgi:hypothetical protein
MVALTSAFSNDSFIAAPLYRRPKYR